MSVVEVKVVRTDGEVKHYQFGSVDLAIVGLGKLVGAPSTKRSDPVPVASGDTTPTAALVATSAVPPVAVAPATRTRKPRSDAGQPRGPHKKDETPEPAATEKTPAEGDKPQPSGVVSAPAAAVPSPEAVQAAVEKIYGSKGYDDTLAVLSRFGVNRGVNLKPEQRADFIAKVERVIAGEAI